jgi:multidrug efflux pump
MLGVMPIALSFGSASGSRQSLGVAVVGGLMVATFLSLFLVPALYTFLSRARKRGEAQAHTSEPQRLPASAE